MFYEALFIPQLYEEPNGTQITPPEPNIIILNSALIQVKHKVYSTKYNHNVKTLLNIHLYSLHVTHR